MIDLDQSLQIAKSAALLAGEFLQKSQGNDHKILLNEGRDLKLQLDIDTENIIKAHISAQSNYPILGEETGSSDKLDECFWVIDPLDGTSNFLRGIPISCVSIALISNLKPVLGVIYDFNHGDLYFGHKESLAFINDQEIQVSSLSLKNESTLVTGIPAKTNYSDDEFHQLISIFQAWKKIRMIGSAAMAAVYVAAGKAETYQENGIFLWDVAAGAAIVSAAGGKASITNLQSDYRVDAKFCNNQIEELLNTKETVAVASRSFSKNAFLIRKLKNIYSSIILNETGRTLEGEDLIAFLKPASKAIIGIEVISDSMLSQLPDLKVISKYGVGLNNLDFELLKNYKIKLGFTPGVNKQSVAELALTLILIGLKKIKENNLDIINGNWSQEKGSELFGKTVGMLGFGNIGQQLASLIQPFKCKIIFFDQKKFSQKNITQISKDLNLNSQLINQMSLESVLSKSDVLSLHLPLLDETKNIISLKELNQLRSHACIINTARGGIVNENDLYSFLLNNPSVFAGFDVYAEEPAFKNPLLNLPNFFGTSHRSSLTAEGINKMGIAAIKGLDDNMIIT